MSDDPLKNLERLDYDSLGSCKVCGTMMLEAGLPLFYRVRVRHCGIEAKAIRERVGLAMMLGGGQAGAALSGVMGTGTKPAVVISESEVNVCYSCAQERMLEVLSLGDEE